ncbi:hypothetical protein DUNSADRAFT_16659 [Dunaliella salina]|uniref:Uncharacterized protein n=1 Tax=Dunaliella salina TaxID=3046 RepID=A0ABQ7G343_DUNSA|nr:hypothetical protein DUNSADRAFT_16659 [Dunaliella salina]|eukprot:KAF5829025.1 hypothetical protein DUNSADRAFT_16659 [Dunaliella salina]
MYACAGNHNCKSQVQGGSSAVGSRSPASEARGSGFCEVQNETSVGCEGSGYGSCNGESCDERLAGEGSGVGRPLHRSGAVGYGSGSSHGSSSSTGGSSFGSSCAENNSARSVSSIGSSSSSGAGSCNAYTSATSLGTPKERRPSSTESLSLPTGRATASALPSSYQSKSTESARGPTGRTSASALPSSYQSASTSCGVQPRPASSSKGAHTARHPLLPPPHPGSPGLSMKATPPQHTPRQRTGTLVETPSSRHPGCSGLGHGGSGVGSPHLRTPGPSSEGAAAGASVGVPTIRSPLPMQLSDSNSEGQHQQQQQHYRHPPSHPHISPSTHVASHQRPSSTPLRQHANGSSTINIDGSNFLDRRNRGGGRDALDDPNSSSSTSEGGAAPAGVPEQGAAAASSQRSPSANRQGHNRHTSPASDKKSSQASIIPRVATLPARRNQLGPPLDATIMAMRMHFLSNRFVTPLLIQQQRQQKKRSARAGSSNSSSSSASIQGGSASSSSSTTRGAAWCRPASAQENQVRARRNLSSLLDENDVSKHK